MMLAICCLELSMTKIVYDIETEVMQPAKMYPWQQNILAQIHSGGFKPGEMMVMSAGRQTGKSMFTAQALKRLMDDLQRLPVVDMVMSEGTVYGSRYYTVEPIGGNWLEMEKWCVKTFGEGNVSPIWGEEKAPEPARRWYANNRKFWFKSEKDRDWFIVMWRS